MGDQIKTNKCGLPQRASLYLNNRCFKIFEGHNIIGRNITAAVNIKDISISKNHAIITVINSNQHFISDNNSANGTNLNTNLLTPLKLYQLEDNDNIQFADVSALYKIDGCEGDSQNSDNTQSSQITGDLYSKLTQQLHFERQGNSGLDNETELVGTTSDPDGHTEEHNDPAPDARIEFDTTNFHEAVTQVFSNDALPTDVEFSSTKCDNSFHYAETQVMDFPVPSCSKDYEAETPSVQSSGPSKTSSPKRCTDHLDIEDSTKENTSVDSTETEGNDDNIRNHSQSSKTGTSSNERYDDNIRDRSQTDNNDSNESMDFMILQQAEEIESQLHVELLQRKKRTVLDSDDENEKNEKVGNEATASTSTNATITSTCSQENLSNIPNKDSSKVDSDCETYIEEGDNLNADHDELYNDTNVIPPTQEDLSEVFNYKSKCPRPEQTTNHTFESSEESFRLNLTQLWKDKAETSQVISSNNTSKSCSTPNRFNDITQLFTTNLPGTSGVNQQVVATRAETRNDSNTSNDKQTLVCSTPIQKDICQEIKQERLSIIDDSADENDDVYLANTQCINQEALETYNIYVQPTQKLSLLNKDSLQIQNSLKHTEKQDANASKECPAEPSDTEDEIYIENTQPVTENIYAKCTQKLPSKFDILSRPTTSKQTMSSENVDSVFLAETVLIAQIEEPPEDVINKSHNDGTDGNIESPVASTSKVSIENRRKGEENNPLNNIFSLETQLITNLKTADTKNTNVCDDNVETQIEVSFSQDNLEPTRILCERPANPLAVLMKGGTQEEHVEDNAPQKQTTQEEHVDEDAMQKQATQEKHDYDDAQQTVDDNNSRIENTKISGIKDNDIARTEESVSKPSSKGSKYRLSTIKTTSNIESVDASSTANDKVNVLSKTIDKTAEDAGKDEDSDTTKEASKMNTRTRMCTRKSSTSETSELKDTRTHSTRIRSKKTQYSEPNREIPIKDQKSPNKPHSTTAILPKKRRLLDSIPEKVDKKHSTNKDSSEDSTIAKRSRRKVLTNVDDVEPEPEPKVNETALEDTSTESRKYTRSAGTSNSNEVCLISKTTRRGKTLLQNADTKTEKSGPHSSTNVLEKSSKVHKKNIVDTKETITQSGSEVKVQSKRISTRNRRNSNKPNENEGEPNKEIKDSEIETPSTRKRKTTLGKSPSVDSSPSLARGTAVDMPQSRTDSTSKNEPHLDILDLKKPAPGTRKRKTTLAKLPSTESFPTSSLSVTSSPVKNVPEEQTPSSGKRRKQRTTAKLETSFSSSTENLKSSGSSISTPERKRRTLKPKVVFTMMDSPLLESAIRHLGGSIVDSVSACTVLVTEKVKRTLKLLTAIGNAKPICTPEWIHESKKARQFLDPWDYILRDPEAEEKWNFSLSDSLHRSSSKKLMDGLSFNINATDNVADVLKNAIEACGGKCLNRITKADASKKIYLVTSQECKSKSAKLTRQHKNLIAIDPEGIFESVLRQEMVLEDHVIEV